MHEAGAEVGVVRNRSSACVAQDVTVWGMCGHGWKRSEYPSQRGSRLGPGVAVAVCTYQRAESLRRFLDSLVGQERQPDLIVIVDASRDDITEVAVKSHPAMAASGEAIYVRVWGERRGLTRQRNVALELVDRNLIAFFDDDVVLRPDCLKLMERAHRHGDVTVVGVGAYMENEFTAPSLRWRMRAAMGVVPSLTPGRYFRSGVSTPWGFMAPCEGSVEGDWLQGCAMMWATEAAREERFNDQFAGYSNGEDLEFGLRMRSHGRLLMVGSARAQHLHEASGRPDAYALGKMTAKNNCVIHATCLRNRTWRDAARFVYATAVDVALALGGLLRGRGARRGWRYTRGYVAGIVENLRAKSAAGRAS